MHVMTKGFLILLAKNGYIYIQSHVADVENKLPAVDSSFYFPESFDSTFCKKWKSHV